MKDEQHTRPRKAVIYCRVSASKQVREGDGLASQENRCREYATYKDYDVVEVFKDDASGKLERRPAMDRMLAFLRLHQPGSVAVIIDDISRFARNVQAHIKLRETLRSAGGVLESPAIEFGEDSDSRLVEHMLASVAQHQREKNAEQTLNRMKGRMMNGYSVFQAPIGYKYQKQGQHGKILTRNEPVASILQEGLEGYASGRFATQSELKRFLDGQPSFPKDGPGSTVRLQRVHEMLNRVIYAGYIEHADWGVSRRKGHHDPIISLETFHAIQQRRSENPMAPRRDDINEDFPLRGAVHCASCDKPLTACWSRSRSGKRYPYYWCKTHGCPEHRKNIRAEVMDARFEKVMRHITPSESLLNLTYAMLKNAWRARSAQDVAAKTQLKKEIKNLDAQQDALLERLVESSNPKVIGALEAKIGRLEDEKLLLSEKAAQKPKRRPTLEELFEPLIAFLSSPWELYKNSSLERKKVILRTAFKGPLLHDRESGFRTTQTSVIFGFFGKFSKKCEMAHP